MNQLDAVNKLLNINICDNLDSLNGEDYNEIFELVQIILSDKVNYENSAILVKKSLN